MELSNYCTDHKHRGKSHKGKPWGIYKNVYHNIVYGGKEPGNN